LRAARDSNPNRQIRSLVTVGRVPDQEERPGL
jgi:hypothetical protein